MEWGIHGACNVELNRDYCDAKKKLKLQKAWIADYEQYAEVGSRGRNARIRRIQSNIYATYASSAEI